MLANKRISIAIHCVVASGYKQLLLKDENGFQQIEIKDDPRLDYYAMIFNAKGYILNRHYVGEKYYGLREGYRVYSIGIPYGYYLTGWHHAFDQMENAFKEVLRGCENDLQIKTNLSRSQTFDDFIANTQLIENKEHFEMNAHTIDSGKSGIVIYENDQDLENYFEDPCRRNFVGYGTVYFVEKGSTAASKLTMRIPDVIQEPPKIERFYSVIIVYYCGNKELGTVQAFPSIIDSLQVPISAKINVPNYEEKIIEGSLAEHLDEWKVKKNADGMGFTLSISLNPKESRYQLKCAELDGAGVEEYSRYITTTLGSLSGKELILKGNEISKEFKIKAIQKDDKIVNFVQNDHVVEFQLRKCFILVNKRILKALEELGLVGVKAELLSSKDNGKIKDIDLNKETFLEGVRSDYKVRFVSDYHKDYVLFLDKLEDRPLKQPIPIETKSCEITINGHNVKSALKKKKEITIEFRIKGGEDRLRVINEKRTTFPLEIPEQKTLICNFKLEGYNDQAVEIDWKDSKKEIILELPKGKMFISNVWNTVKKGALSFAIGLLIGCAAMGSYFLRINAVSHSPEKVADKHLDSISALVESALVEIVEAKDIMKNLQRNPGNIPPEEVEKDLKEAKNKVEKAEQEVNQAALEIQAKEYIECLSGIDFTQDDVNKAKKYYDDHVSALSQETEKLLRSKIGCAEYLLKACKKGFGTKSVQDILKNSYSTFLSEEQKSILNFFITQQQSCSQVEGKSLREKQINLKEL